MGSESQSETQRLPTPDMACFKTFTLSGGCVLETCETKDALLLGIDDDSFPSLAYSPDHCYCLVVYHDNADNTTRIAKYNLETNTVTDKHLLASSVNFEAVYDATAQKFIVKYQFDVVIFDPVTETAVTFASGLTTVFNNLLYIPEKGKVYGTMGVNGSNERYVGYIDVDLQTVVQLGILPAIGLGRPAPSNWAYSTVADALYGNWASGGDQRMIKFDLATNTASYIVIGLNAARVWWDGDRNLLITDDGGNLYEFDTSTDTVTGTVPFDANFRMDWPAFKDESTNTIWGRGDDLITGFNCLVGLDLDTNTWILGLTDYAYGRPLQFGDDGSCIVGFETLAGTEAGLRKVCVS